METIHVRKRDQPIVPAACQEHISPFFRTSPKELVCQSHKRLQERKGRKEKRRGEERRKVQLG